jgi:hypothetical protein
MIYRVKRLRLLAFLVLLVGVTAAFAQGEVEPEATAEALRNPALLQDTALLTSEPCSVENVQVQKDANSEAKAASWSGIEGDECCQLFSADGQTVSVLFLRLAPDIKLGELVEVQGEPAFALGSPFTDDQAIVNLIYPTQQMVVYAFVSGVSGSLSANSEIVGFLLMSPEELDLLLGTSNLFEWRGYADYAAYSPDEGAAFDVTPSMTVTPSGG